MNASELYDSFRSDVVDVAKPYLWSDDEVFRYMDTAYRMFVRLTGGIADFSNTDVCQVPLVTGEDVYDLHPSLLRIMSASLESNGAPVEVINSPQMTTVFQSNTDYGVFRTLSMNNDPGDVRWMVMGMEKDKTKVIRIPMADDILNLLVYRLPLTNVVDDTHNLAEVEDEHHVYLLDWMKHLAYKKQDAETFNKEKSDNCALAFRNYCEFVKAEWSRYKHKNRTVAYGGI